MKTKKKVKRRLRTSLSVTIHPDVMKAVEKFRKSDCRNSTSSAMEQLIRLGLNSIAQKDSI